MAAGGNFNFNINISSNVGGPAPAAGGGGGPAPGGGGGGRRGRRPPVQIPTAQLVRPEVPTEIAQQFLALSSVLRPLSATLGNVAMSAGFAAFSFGAVLAGITLVTTALAGFISVMKSASAAATEAGVQVGMWRDATREFRMTSSRSLIEFGLVVQQAFAPALKNITTLLDSLEPSGMRVLVMGFEALATTISLNAQGLRLFVFSLNTLGRTLELLGFQVKEPLTVMRDFTAQFVGVGDLGKKIQREAASTKIREDEQLKVLHDILSVNRDQAKTLKDKLGKFFSETGEDIMENLLAVPGGLR